MFPFLRIVVPYSMCSGSMAFPPRSILSPMVGPLEYLRHQYLSLGLSHVVQGREDLARNVSLFWRIRIPVSQKGQASSTLTSWPRTLKSLEPIQQPSDATVLVLTSRRTYCLDPRDSSAHLSEVLEAASLHQAGCIHSVTIWCPFSRTQSHESKVKK